MKRILFVVENLNMNGAIKSLTNLLSLFDYSKYEVDLFSYTKEGMLLESISSKVNILPQNEFMHYFATDYKTVIKSKSIIAKIIRFFSAIERKLFKTSSDYGIRFLLWCFVKPLEKKYDTAIAWTEGSTHRFILKKVNADKKIGWCHIDDNAIPIHQKLQKKAFPKLDYIVTVSKTCKNILLKKYNLKPEKICVIRNIMPIDTILAQSNNASPYTEENTFKILTIARAERFKNTDDIFEASKIIYNRGYNIHWYLIGGGYSEKQYDLKLPYLSVCKASLNPYPYIKYCNAFASSSSGEAWGMAVNEAKVLGKPIIVSDIPVFHEQVVNGENGIIYGNTADQLAEAIIKLIEDKDLYKKIENNLACGDYSNYHDIEKLYQIIESE